MGPLLPSTRPRRGGRWRDHRQILNGILFRVRTGIPWRDLPERYGPWQTVYKRFARWQTDGTWTRIEAALRAQADAAGELDWDAQIDSTVVRAHQHAAGARKRGTRRSRQEVVVLGYRSEPYLRIGPTGVDENQRSPSAYANRFANAPNRIPPDLDPAAPPQWHRIRNQPDAIWHDHRTHWSGPDPPAVTTDRGHRQVVVPNWQIPLRLGQHTVLIEGDIVWVPGPSPWPWALLALAAFAVTLTAGWRGWLGLLALLVVVAVAADLAHTVGAFAASTAPVLAKAYAGLISVGGWVAAVVAVWQLRRGRLQAGRLLLLLAGTFLAFAGALPDVGALASSQLASTLDPALSRAAIALTLGVGLAMIAASLLNPGTTRPTTQPRETAG